MAIALHNAPASPSDALMNAGWRHDGTFPLPPAGMADKRVNVMTTMAANIDNALSLQRVDTAEDFLEPCSCGLGLTGHGDAYNEEAFHHFLAIERKRSEASTRPFLLLLVEFEKRLGASVPIGHDIAAGLFAALTESLRDTDVIGWYREQRIAGAVLTDLGDAPQAIVPHIIDRVRQVLGRDLDPDMASQVQVRVYQLPARTDAPAVQPRIAELV
jgi:hypothetical protein